MLTPADLIDPFGPILPEWFDDASTLEARLQVYLDEAYAKEELANAEDEDQAVTRWVEYRVFDRMVRGAAGSAGLKSASFSDQGSFTLAVDEQRATWGRSSSHALQAWRLLTAPPEVVRSADGRTVGFTWALPESGS